jgi:hypothetical protein
MYCANSSGTFLPEASMPATSTILDCLSSTALAFCLSRRPTAAVDTMIQQTRLNPTTTPSVFLMLSLLLAIACLSPLDVLLNN